MSASKILYVAAMVYSALFFLGLASIAATASSAPVWQAPAFVGIAAFLWLLAFDVVRKEIGL